MKIRRCQSEMHLGFSNSENLNSPQNDAIDNMNSGTILMLIIILILPLLL